MLLAKATSQAPPESKSIINIGGIQLDLLDYMMGSHSRARACSQNMYRIITIVFTRILFSLISVTISTSTFFDGLLVTGLYTSTSVQASQSIGGSSAFGFGKSSVIYLLPCRVMNTWLYRGHQYQHNYWNKLI